MRILSMSCPVYNIIAYIECRYIYKFCTDTWNFFLVLITFVSHSARVKDVENSVVRTKVSVLNCTVLYECRKTILWEEV